MQGYSKVQIVLLAVIFLCSGVFSSMAATANKIEKSPQRVLQKLSPSSAANIMPAGDYPDLTVGTMAWIDHVPAPGNKVGYEGVLRVDIVNKGKKVSENTYIKFTCQPLTGTPCPDGVNVTLPCQALVSIPKSLSWPPLVSGSKTWKDGTYRLTIEVDSPKKVTESNEVNNIVHKDFTVYSKVVNAPASSQNQNTPPQQGYVPYVQPDVVIQNIKMTPVLPSVDEHIKFIVTFRNIGNGLSGNMHMTYDFYRTGADGVRHHTNGNNIFDPRALAPGEILERSYVLHPYDDAQPHDYEVPRSGDTIEAVFTLNTAVTTYIQESNTNNNSKSITFKLK